jgi:Flp pilus assembly secretin CpaC
MKKTRLACICLLLLIITPTQAQLGQPMALLNSPGYEAAARSLRVAAPRQYNFSKAVLSDVMRLMAEDAGIGFFGLPDGVDGAESLVTFTINASPFTALETLARANGVALIYENGIWYLRPANDQELIGRIYEINYNAQELVTKNTQGSVGNSGGNSGSSNGGSNGGSTAGGLSLQGAPDFFVTEPSRILEDIQNILDIQSSGSATFAPSASVDTIGQFSLGNIQGQPNLVVRPQSNAEGEASAQAKVIWNSDSNTLYVVATRQQHQWIEAYLASADRPQPMIAVEVKFLETSRDPSSDIGIDWDGVLGQNGLEANLTDATGPLNLASLGSYSLPTAVLSYSDLNLKLRAIFDDRRTRSVSYPRMVTLDNREVSFRSVVNQPVLGSSSSTSLGAGATETSAVEYLPIGTVINILPKTMAGDKILLNVSVTVSDIIGTEVINGNPFPIATSRVYTAPLTVKSGYTVAISGLDAARSSEAERGVPILGRLPIVNMAFKNKATDRTRQHLMMLITPIILNPGVEGLTKKPVTREPWESAPMATAYGKETIPADGAYPDPHPRMNHRATPVDNQIPIEEIPAFNQSAADRKANGTFGKASEQVYETPVARTAQRTLGGGVTMASGSLDSGNSVTVIDISMPPAAASGPDPATAAVSHVADAAPIPSSLNTPMVVDGAPQEASADNANSPAGNEVANLAQRAAVMKQTLDSIPEGESELNADEAKRVSLVLADAQLLLEKVDSLRNSRSGPLQGDLGDAWWELINVKTAAMKLSRRIPENLASH